MPHRNKCLHRSISSLQFLHIGRKASQESGLYRSSTLKSRTASFMVHDFIRGERTDGCVERTVHINEVDELDNAEKWGKMRHATRIVINDEYRKMQEFPQGLLQLASLTSLCISSSELKQLPKEISQLKLRSLELKDNKSLRSVSPVKRILSLIEFDMSGNSCSLPQSLHSLSLLTSLKVHANKPAQLPHSIRTLSSLECFSYTCEGLVKIRSSSINNLNVLRQIDISQNKLRELPDSIGCLVNLEELRVSYNKLQHLPSTMSNLIKLKRLFLSSNKFTCVPEVISKLISLNYLNMRKNNIQEMKFLADNDSGISFLDNLNTLLLDDNLLEEIPSVIFNFRLLETLSLANNNIRVIDNRLEQLKSLKCLSLGGNVLVEKIPDNFNEMISLRHVDLRNTGVTTLSAGLLSFLQRLSLFNLDDCPLSDDLKTKYGQGLPSLITFFQEQTNNE